MERYELLKMVGEGSFGCVFEAIDKETGELVAIKWLKHASDSSYSEISSLIHCEHSNVVKLKGVLHEYNGHVYLVFEYMECGSLHRLIQARRSLRLPFSEAQIQSLVSQILHGLAFMHGQGYMHRDLKPDNLLMNKQGMVKIADLGSATKIHSRTHPFNDYVTTRWYRAPEMLLRSFIQDNKRRPFFYDDKVDMWAVGTIMAELYRMQPLFQGVDSADQVSRISTVIESELYEGIGLRAVIPRASDSALDLMEVLCSWEPNKRPTAAEALQHPFFKKVHQVEALPRFTSYTGPMNMVPKIIGAAAEAEAEAH